MSHVPTASLDMKEISRVSETFQRGLVRVAAEEKGRFRHLSDSVRKTIEKKGDLEPAVADVLRLDEEWQQLGREAGLLGCGDAKTSIVVFLAGVIVGLIIAAAIDEIND